MVHVSGQQQVWISKGDAERKYLEEHSKCCRFIAFFFFLNLLDLQNHPSAFEWESVSALRCGNKRYS